MIGPHIRWQVTLLGFVLIMQDEDTETSEFGLTTEFGGGNLDVLLEFGDGIFERGASVVDLVDDDDVLAYQVGHLETTQVEPLCACHFGAGRFDDLVVIVVGVDGGLLA